MSRKSERFRFPDVACPHCECRATVRTSEQLTLIVREYRFRCENDECGHTFVATMEITRTVQPSGRPNPNVHLPMAPRRPTPRPANDDVPVPNDNLLIGTG